MANELINQEQFNQLKALSPQILGEVLASKGSEYQEAYNTLLGQEAKIMNALSAFEGGDPKRIKEFTKAIGTSDVKFSKTDLDKATEQAKDTQRSLDEFKTTRVPNVTKWKVTKNTRSFEEFAKIIEVETGLSIEDQVDKSSYSDNIKTVLKSMKDKLPKTLYNEKYTKVWDAWRSLNKGKTGSYKYGYFPSYAAETAGEAPLTTYFNLKQEDATADNILEGMFSDPELYQAWLSIEENQ